MNQTNSSEIISASTSSTSLSPTVLFSSFIRIIGFIFGIISNSLNICVFLNPKLKETNYRYMLADSITNMSYQALLFIGTIFGFFINISSNQFYFSAFFQISITNYFTSSLAIMRIAIEITLSVQIYCILRNKNWINRVSYKVMLTILGTLCVVIYLFIPFQYNIVQTIAQNGSTQYTPVLNDFGNSSLGKSLAVSVTLFRLFLVSIVLSILNILNAIEFRKRYGIRRVTFLEPNLINPNNTLDGKLLRLIFY